MSIWGKRNVQNNGTSSSIVKSGANITKVEGLGKLKEQFVKSLTLSESDANPETLAQLQENVGEFRSFNAVYKRVAREKIRLAGEVVKTMGIKLQHADQAMAQEIQYGRTVAKGFEGMSEKMLDLTGVEAEHTGFTRYLDRADKLIQWD